MTESRTPRPLLSWPLLPLPDEHGRLRWPSLEESVRQSIEALLRTRPGELLMRPLWGAGLGDLGGEPSSLETRTRIQELVRSALRRWEQRIELERVDVTEVDGAPTHLDVTIAYRLRRTGAAQTVAVALDTGA
jgi:phage baseplate assembly protein W